MIFADSTIPGFAKPGAIHLRTVVRKPEKHRDLRAAEGIILSALIGGNLIIWAYVLIRAFA